MRAHRALSLLMVAAGWSTSAAAQEEYPNRPIHMIVGFAAGSGADILARPIAMQLEKLSGKAIVVDNKPGNNGNLSLTLAANARPDGYTLLYGSGSTIGAAPHMVKDFPVNVERDIVPIRTTSIGTFVLTVPPNSPAKTVSELTAHLKSRTQNKFGYATNISQVAAHLYLTRVGAEAAPVAYRTGPEAIPDITSGVLDFFILDSTFGLSQMKAGKVRGIAVTSARRSSIFPDLPTMQEAGIPNFDFSPWFAIFVPRGTPQPVIAKIDAWMKDVMASDVTSKHFATYGAALLHEGADDIRARIRKDLALWSEAVKAAQITPQ